MSTQSPKQYARSLLWSLGELSWKLRPEQKLFKSAIEQEHVKLFVGNVSRRWGKSFTMVLFAIEQSLKNPKIHIRYAAAFQTDLEEFIIPAFNAILEDCPSHLQPQYLSSKKVWKFPNGSSIKLVGTDKNKNGLRGNAINIIILDEAAFISDLKYLYTNIIIPATAKQKNIKIVVISTPPESPEHYFVELINKAKLIGSYLENTIDDISDLSQDEKTRLLDEVGGQYSTTAQREFYAKIIIEAERAAVPDFNEALHSVDFTTPSHGIWLVAGDTGGVRDKTALLLMTYDYLRNKILVVDERYYNSNTPSSVWVKDAILMEEGRICTRIVDAHGQTQIDLSYEGYSSSLPRKDDFHAGLTLLRNTFYKNEIEIHPRCKFLLQSLKGGMLTKNRNDFERTESLGHLDAVAALIYGIRSVDKTTNPFPSISLSDTYVPNNLSKTLTNLRALGAR